MWEYEIRLKAHVKIRNTIKSTPENKKYDEKHTKKYEIRLKAHVKLRNTIKSTHENAKYE